MSYNICDNVGSPQYSKHRSLRSKSLYLKCLPHFYALPKTRYCILMNPYYPCHYTV